VSTETTTFGPGDVIGGRFRLGRLLGEGGSSMVYVAEVVAPFPREPANSSPNIGSRAITIGDRVALKLIHPHLARESQIARRFAREARILERLVGEHLASFLDYGELPDGQLFMAQELVEGASLDQVAGGRPLPPERAVTIMLQICTALEVAHDAGVIHRDLKPLNVIVQVRDGKDHARVLDFGMAKILRGELKQSMNALTQQNMVFGTPEYIAPEQARGDEVDERADIYSAGVILYELLTGSVPFQSNTPVATMTAHLLQPPEPPSRRAPRAPIPPALEELVLHALAKQPRERYPGARAMATALRSALDRPNDTDSIRPPTAAPDPGSWDTDLALHMTESLRPTETQLEPPEAPAADTEAPPPLNRGVLWFGIGAALLGVVLGILMSLVGAL
jgi:serine/threonine protein kinase